MGEPGYVHTLSLESLNASKNFNEFLLTHAAICGLAGAYFIELDLDQRDGIQQILQSCHDDVRSGIAFGSSRPSHARKIVWMMGSHCQQPPKHMNVYQHNPRRNLYSYARTMLPHESQTSWSSQCFTRVIPPPIKSTSQTK